MDEEGKEIITKSMKCIHMTILSSLTFQELRYAVLWRHTNQ